MKDSIVKLLTHFIVYVILFQDTLYYYIHNSIVSSLDELLISIYALFALIYCLTKGKIKKNSLIILIISILFFVVGCISGIKNSDYQPYPLIMGGVLMVKFYILIFSVINAPLKDKIVKYIIDALKFAGFICAIIGIFNFIFPSLYLKTFHFGFKDDRLGFTSAMSLFVHPGIFGWFMLFVGIYYFSKCVSDRSKKYFLLSLFYVIVALLSLKVKVIFGVIFVLMTYVFIIEKRKIKIYYMMITGLIVFTFWVIFRDIIYNNYILYFTANNNISARYALTQTSFHIMKDYFPIGVGFAKFASWYARLYYSEFYYKYGLNSVYGLNPNDPNGAFFGTDTFWPAIIGETGLIGVTVYTFLLVYILYLLYVKNTKLNKSYYGIFPFLIFIQAIVESTGEQIFNSSPQNIFIGIIIGLALSKRNELKYEKNSILHA